eukprot:TRINITY_DN1607_c0_g1_i1.p1 TRINITY_DN1607_c0_g1~~TRINITY_DN1607_c0_g1_i1.p1  ORF type:complete len:371 (+),score=1.60 TRINITY_DN1607_c0_g1_i1:188-1300(+)
MAENANANANANGEIKVANDESFLKALLLTSATCLPMAVKAALDLNVFQIIADEGAGAALTPRQIMKKVAQAENVSNPTAHVALDRILSLLASHSVLTCRPAAGGGAGERVYGLSDLSVHLVSNSNGVSLGPLLLMNHDKVFMDTWQFLKCAVTEGAQPFVKAHGVGAFEYPAHDERFNALFNRAMSQHSGLMMAKILDVYRGFEHVSELVDVGGGVGLTSSMIVTRHPHIKATNFDMPHVVSTAPAHPGVVHVGGDMFDSVPPAQAILMKWILHDWSDELCIRLLKNCHKALPENGKVIVIEHMLPTIPEASTCAQESYQVDLLMLAYNPGGKERTEQDFRDLAHQSGFKGGLKPICCVSGIWVMELYK